MTWTRLPDDFTDRPGVLRLSRSSRLLHVEALVWSNRLLTDGVIPATVVRRISDSDQLDQDVAELAEAGLWTRLEDGSWQVDWSDQEPAEKVEKRRNRHNEKQRKYNDRKERHTAGDHSICDPRFCRDASRDRSHDPTDDGLPSRPVPSRPEGEGQGQGKGSGSTSSHGSAPLRRDSSPPPPPGRDTVSGGTPPGTPDLPGPPLGVIPTVSGVPVWGPGSAQEVKR